jgi:hypothetical protein
MTRTALIFATAALAIPAIASAEPKPDASTANPATTARAPRYCVVDTPTGSNIERRTCKSLDAWLAEGFDPRVKK